VLGAENGCLKRLLGPANADNSQVIVVPQTGGGPQEDAHPKGGHFCRAYVWCQPERHGRRRIVPCKSVQSFAGSQALREGIGGTVWRLSQRAGIAAYVRLSCEGALAGAFVPMDLTNRPVQEDRHFLGREPRRRGRLDGLVAPILRHRAPAFRNAQHGGLVGRMYLTLRAIACSEAPPYAELSTSRPKLARLLGFAFTFLGKVLSDRGVVLGLVLGRQALVTLL
jgi:hypothetical protein